MNHMPDYISWYAPPPSVRPMALGLPIDFHADLTLSKMEIGLPLAQRIRMWRFFFILCKYFKSGDRKSPTMKFQEYKNCFCWEPKVPTIRGDGTAYQVRIQQIHNRAGIQTRYPLVWANSSPCPYHRPEKEDKCVIVIQYMCKFM